MPGGSVTPEMSILPRVVTSGRIGKTKANFFLRKTHRKILEDSYSRSKRVIKPPFRFACMRATPLSTFRSLSSKTMTSSSAKSSPGSSTFQNRQIQKNPRPKSKRVIKPPFRFACMRATSPSTYRSSKSVTSESSPKILPVSSRFKTIKKRPHPKTKSKRAVVKPPFRKYLRCACIRAEPPSVSRSRSSSGISSYANSSTSTEFQVRRRREPVWKESDFANLVEIGSGAYGKVYRAFAKPLNDIVALKLIELKTATVKYHTNDIGLEYRLQRSISHPNLCRVLGEYSDMTNRVLIMEFCAGDLHEYIYKAENMNRLPDQKKCKRFVQDLVSAVVYLHGKAGYIHMDLKPENILLTSHDVLKITDFGSAIKMINYRHHHSYDSHRGGTIAYRPPEMLRKIGYDSTADVWAIGCVAYELLMQDHPFFSYATRQRFLPEDEVIRRGLVEIKHMRNGSFQEKFKKMLPSQAASFFRQIFGPWGNRPLVRDLEGLRWLNSYHEHYSSPFSLCRSGTG